MANDYTKSQINLSKNALKNGVVVLNCRVYERMLKTIEELRREIERQREIEEVRGIIREGKREYKGGKTVEMHKFLKKEYPNLYAKHFSKS